MTGGTSTTEYTEAVLLIGIKIVKVKTNSKRIKIHSVVRDHGKVISISASPS